MSSALESYVNFCPLKFKSVLLLKLNWLHSRHGYRSKKFPAATYVRDYFINFTKSPKKLKKCAIFCNRNWLEVYYYKLPYNQGQ